MELFFSPNAENNQFAMTQRARYQQKGRRDIFIGSLELEWKKKKLSVLMEQLNHKGQSNQTKLKRNEILGLWRDHSGKQHFLKFLFFSHITHLDCSFACSLPALQIPPVSPQIYIPHPHSVSPQKRKKSRPPRDINQTCHKQKHSQQSLSKKLTRRKRALKAGKGATDNPYSHCQDSSKT